MFYFPYIGNHNPNWRSYFSEGLKSPPSYLIISVCCTLQIVQKHDVSTTIETSLSDLRSIEVKDASPDDVAFFVMDKITLRRAEWSSGRFLFKENWGNSFRTSTTFNLLHQIDILWSNMSFPEGFKIKLVVNGKIWAHRFLWAISALFAFRQEDGKRLDEDLALGCWCRCGCRHTGLCGLRMEDMEVGSVENTILNW